MWWLLCLAVLLCLDGGSAFRITRSVGHHAAGREHRTGETKLDSTLIEALEQDPNFSTFASLLNGVPELKSLLSDSSLAGGGGNIFTVFAPSNAVFAKLDKQIMFKLGKKDNLPILRKVVRFHFVEEVLTQDDIAQLKEMSTLALLPVSIKPGAGGRSFKLNEASVTRTFDSCENGIIHEVDSLVSPFLLFRFLV